MRENLIEQLISLNLKSATRNAVRKHISEYDYLREFGTFTEFKRQAGLLNLKSHNKYSNAVANNATTTTKTATKITSEIKSYNTINTYERPHAERFQTIVIGSDYHSHDHCPFTRALFIDSIARIQPNTVVLLGDFFDCYEFSSYTKDPRKLDLVGEFACIHKLLADIRQAAPDCEIDFIAGNHEHRILKHIANEAPFVQQLLSDVHGFSFGKLLGFDDNEINFICKGDLFAHTNSAIKREVKQNYLIKHEALMFNHFPDGRNYGIPGLNGHHHSYHSTHQYNITYGPYSWVQLGSMCIRDASYCDGLKWTTGFMIAHVDTHTKASVFEYIDTTSDHAVIGGQFYTRDMWG
jgi:hypothetical protein